VTPLLADSDEEQPYELRPRTETTTKEMANTKLKMIPRLPIKLANGQIEKTGERVGSVEAPTASGSSEGEEEEERPLPEPRNDVATGARFGRPAVADVLTTKSRKCRVQAAKEQIAGICQDIITEPENGVSQVPTPTLCR
jgi:nucleolar complex protein 3